MTTDRGPFSDIRVLELGQYVSVPYAAELLAHGGAEVIKVEPIGGDITRATDRLADGEGRQYVIKARGKRGIAIDLATDEGRAIARRLALGCDVVLSNMRPGTTERLGLDEASLRAERADLVYGEVTGFGTTGPDAHRASLDSVAQAASGLLLSHRALEDDGRPLIGDGFLADYMSGALLAFGVAAALRERDRSGLGQKVNTSLLQAALALQHASANVITSADDWKHDFADWMATERPSLTDAADRRRRHLPDFGFFYNAYATIDGAIVVGAVGAMRPQLLNVIGVAPPSQLPAADDLDARRRVSESMVEQVRAAIARWTTVTLIAALDEVGIPCARARFVEETMLDPATIEGGHAYRAMHPVLGEMILPSAPVTLSRSRYQAAETSPAYGEHTADVLHAFGWTEDDVRDLAQRGVVGLPTVPHHQS